MSTSNYTILVLSYPYVKTPTSCVILLLDSLTLSLCKWENEEGEKAFPLLSCCAIVSCYFIHSNENNDITIEIIPPNIVARKSSLLNSESHNSLTNPHRTGNVCSYDRIRNNIRYTTCKAQHQSY